MARPPKRTGSAEPSNGLVIVCLSDTHELHRGIEVPPGGVLIHAGDFTMFSKSASAIVDFNEWLRELPHRHKIVVPGNHEFFLEADPSRRSLLSNATVLINEGIEIMGLNIWGSPTTPLYGGAFGLSAEQDRIRLFSSIPGNTDILVTHGPPWSVFDVSPGAEYHAGDRVLYDRVMQLKPKLHVFGHIHGSYGTFSIEDTLFVNAALLGPNGDLSEPPIVLRIPRV